MTAFLASVRSPEEAGTVLAADADIIDLKEPDHGALGAVTRSTAEAVRSIVGPRVELTATAGDPVRGPAGLRRAVRELVAAGIETVKVPVVPETAAAVCTLVADETRQGVNIVAVLICDERILLEQVPALVERGAVGVMLDTLNKAGPTPVQRHGLIAIREFIDCVHACGRFAGIAGGLNVSDIEPLLNLKPDLLGFRGALCENGRGGDVDLEASLRIRAAIPKTGHDWQLRGNHHHDMETRA